jgi:hypothetical protein
MPGSARELALVFVLVTIHAKRELDLELSPFPCRNVTGAAGHRGVRKDQREAGLRVVGD